jgi:phosphohistidine swiveling domain-containing protein
MPDGDSAERSPDNGLYVRPFSSIDRAALNLAGGKATNLGELMRAGFPVPHGFYITTEAYRLATEAAGIDPLVAELAAGGDEVGERREAVARQIRAALVDATMPEGVAAAVAEAYRSMASADSVGVAVRSSATAEDLPGASFAGQQDTYLNVVGVEAVLDAVRRCWASLWTDRAVAYRASNRIDQRSVRLAVVVQEMVDAAAAGVMFTANPLTGRRRELVIDASPGLGEAIVSGAVNPDHFVVDGATGRIVERRLGDKRLAVRVRPGGGTEHIELADGGSGASLSDEQIRALASMGGQVEQHYGTPQDIEFAIDASGKLWLTQARPITTLYPLPPRLTDDGDLRVYFSINVAQGVFRPFTPMGVQVLRLIGSAMAGLLFEPLRDPLSGPSLIVEAGHRLFFDITPVIRSDAGQQVFVKLSGQMEARTGTIVRELADDPRLAARPTSRLRLALGVARALARTRAPLRTLQAIHDPARARARAERAASASLTLGETAAGADPRTRLAAVERLFLEGLPTVIPRYFPIFLSGFLTYGLASYLLRGLVTPEELDIVRRSLPHNPTTEMDLELWALAERVRSDESSARVLGGRDVVALADAYRAGTLPSVLQHELSAFLAQYGHRGVAEIDAGLARWSEDPAHILGVLANYLQVDAAGQAPDRQFEGARVEAEATVRELARRAGRGSRARGRLVRFLLTRARDLMGVRERPKFYFVQLIAKAREHLWRVGEALAQAGRIETAGDIFFLSLPEARRALGGADLRSLVVERRASYELELHRRRVPRILLSDGTEPTGQTASADGALRGTPASAGMVTARARVILDPTGARLEPGEVLVAPSTDPGWTPLFLTASGLVMEMGGAMSHGAVVAREYGIPAVVGVASAVDSITTGQTITVDGTAGTIRLVSDP